MHDEKAPKFVVRKNAQDKQNSKKETFDPSSAHMHLQSLHFLICEQLTFITT